MLYDPQRLIVATEYFPHQRVALTVITNCSFDSESFAGTLKGNFGVVIADSQWMYRLMEGR